MASICFSTVKQKYEIASSLFLIASVTFVCIAVVYLAATVPFAVADINASACAAKKSSDFERFYYESSLLWGGIFYFAAAMIFKFKIDEDGETYEKILANNVQQSIPREGWWSYCNSNTYVMCGWLVLIGSLPLCFYPVFPFPWIMLMVILFMIVFIIAAQPHYLLMNRGKGSICLLSLTKQESGETNDDVRYVTSSSSFCAMTGEDSVCLNKRPFASDILICLLVFCIFSVFFLVASLTNLACHQSSIAAYMWVITSLCFTIGLFFWYHASIAPRSLRNRRKYDTSDDGLLGMDSSIDKQYLRHPNSNSYPVIVEA